MARYTLDKTRSSLRFLLGAFRTVLEDVGADTVANLLPWPHLQSESATQGPVTQRFPDDVAESCLQAYSIALQLLNVAEENVEAQRRRDAEQDGRLAEDAGSWDQMLARAGASGASADMLSRALNSIRVEPVFTAHPTEAKRQTVLEQHRQLYRLVVELENAMWTPAERSALEQEVEACLERLWRTGEIYLDKPSLADERRNVLHYLRHVFPDVLPLASARLRAAWDRAGLDAEVLAHPSKGPKIDFGNWVGGDRDGHPGVTPEVTAETLALFRHSALALVDEGLTTLGGALSLSDLRQPTPAVLEARIAQLAARLGHRGSAAVERNADEPWRQYVNLLRAALPLEDREGMGCFGEASELLEALDFLREQLFSIEAGRIARSNLDPVIQVVDAFGFHLARVDVRQNSDFHDRALAQLLVVAGTPDGIDYPDWDTDRRRALLEAELATRRPFASTEDIREGEAYQVIEAHRQLSRYRQRFGEAGLGALIVSMTRSVEDLLIVYLLAREGRLLLDDEDERICPLEVVPLFETIDDLERAPAILDEYLKHPMVRASLRYRQRVQGLDEPTQQVMVGYSDSGKDGGIACSFWSLYRGQSRLAEVGRRNGVAIRFFHGRGGTIGRGAGPTHRFVKALPARTLNGHLRVTEQGETIAQKYANRVTAAHHLELLTAGSFLATVADHVGRSDPPELLALMDDLSRDSRQAYRALLETEGFVTFFEQATPLDAIESSRIGSRPARRTGRRTLADLRAIPWVFAWNQSRFILPGWFGLGSALMGLYGREPDRFEMLVTAKREATRWDPLHYLVSNAATAHMTSSPTIMRRYAELVEDESVRERVMARIEEEHGLARRALELIYGAPLPSARAAVHEALELRHLALVPLHEHQISVLRRFRDLRARGEQGEADQLLPQLLLTVNAIASGLGSTG